MARLEPLVQRHQKISRLTINNNNQIESCYESQNQLEKIDESYKNQQYDGAGMAAAKSGSISINNRRSKPYSANQPKNKLTAALSSKHTNQMLMSKQFQAAPVTGTSTHYTSNNFATAKNFLPSSVNKQNEQTTSSTSMMTKQNNPNGQMLLMNATVLSSADSMGIDRSSDNNLNNDRRPVTSDGGANEYILPANPNSRAALLQA